MNWKQHAPLVGCTVGVVVTLIGCTWFACDRIGQEIFPVIRLTQVTNEKLAGVERRLQKMDRRQMNSAQLAEDIKLYPTWEEEALGLNK